MRATTNQDRKPVLVDVAEQSWLRAPSVPELQRMAARRLFWSAVGWMLAAANGALFLWACSR